MDSIGFKASGTKIGNGELENWTLLLESPRIQFRFVEVSVGDHPVVILGNRVGASSASEVQWTGVHPDMFVQVGSQGLFGRGTNVVARLR